MESSMALTVSHWETQVAHKLEYWQFMETRDKWYNFLETTQNKLLKKPMFEKTLLENLRFPKWNFTNLVFR